MQKIGSFFPLAIEQTPRGLGVFALVNIPADAIVETAPGIIVSQGLLNNCHFAAAADGMLPEDVILDQYGLGWPGGKVFFPMGWVGLYNHSDTPNAEFYYTGDGQTLSIRSIVDIPADAEILVHYGEDWWAKKPFLQKI